MFLPSSQDAVWVPIGLVEWNFIGATKYEDTLKHQVFDDTVARDPSDDGLPVNGESNDEDISWNRNAHQILWSPPFTPPE